MTKDHHNRELRAAIVFVLVLFIACAGAGVLLIPMMKG